jgi:hypothetical protein
MTEEKNNLEIWRDAVSGGPECISLDELQQMLANSSSKNVSRHVERCPHCQASLAMLKSFESAKPVGRQAASVAWIVARLRTEPSEPTSAATTPLPHRAGFSRLPYWAGSLAAALIIGLGLSVLINRTDQPAPIVEPSGPQTMRSTAVHLIGPAGSVVQTPLKFQWNEVPGAASYSVQLMEVDGSSFWSGSTSQNALLVSPELKAAMRPGKPLLWKVVALDASGREVATSSRERFVIVPANENRP